MSLRLCWLILLTLLSVRTQANDSARLYNFNTGNGLPSNNVYSLLRDRLGYIWLATDNGVCKYNGYEFKVFNTEDGLPANDVWKIDEDAAGRIWLYSNSYEIGYIKNDLYVPVRLGNSSTNVFTKGIIAFRNMIGILYIVHNQLYFGVVMPGGATQSIALHNFPPVNNKGIKLNLLSVDHHFWLHYDSLVFRMDLSAPPPFKGEWRQTQEESYRLLARANNMIALGDYVYIFTFRDHFIHTYNFTTNRFSFVGLDNDEGNGIYTAYEEKDGLHVITEKKHYVINGDQKTVTDLPKLRPAAQVAYVGAFGDTWYATNNDGAWLRTYHPLLQEHLLAIPALRNAVPVGHNRDTSYWWSNKENLLITTIAGSVAGRQTIRGYGPLRFVLRHGGVTYYSFNNGIFSGDVNGRNLTNIFEGKPAYLYHYYLRGTSKAVDKFPDSLANAYFRNVYQLHPVSAGSFIALANGSAGLLQIKPDRVELTRLDKERLTGMLNLDRLGLIFLYNKRNVFLYSRDLKKRLHVDNDLMQAIGVTDILKLVTDNRGRIFILTDEQLYSYIPGQLPRPIYTGLNLNSSDLFCSGQHLVLTGDFGVAAAKLDEDGTNAFNILPNFKTECYRKITASHVDASGNVLLITDKDAYVLSDSVLKSGATMVNSASPLISFELAAGHTRALKQKDTLVLEPDDKRFSINTLNYLGGKHPELFYSVDNGPWEKSPSNEIITDGFEPDRYYNTRYYLQDEFWKSPVRELSILQLPLWYQRRSWQAAFLIATALLFIGSIIVAVTITRRLVAKATEKRRLQTELELRAIHSQINPHFIFNTLSAALYFISKQQNKEAYDHVSKFSKLLRNYLKSSRERFITLADEIDILRQYIELQRARFSKAFQYEFHVDEGILTNHILLPSLLLQPLVENAINHGLFNKAEHGLLLISFRKGRSDSELICTIDDNGIGRAKARAFGNRQKKPKSSYGTALTRELISTFKRYEQMDIDLEYIDKTEPETGTIVKLTIRNVKVVAPSPEVKR